jgi:hypothetical protein
MKVHNQIFEYHREDGSSKGVELTYLRICELFE